MAEPTDKLIQTGLVSTIIPVFNRATMLREAVQSVLDQDYNLLEVIIVDDGSTDETSNVVKRLESEHSNIRSIRIKNSGAGMAREAGRKIARGEYIQYLDSDDLLLPTKFSKQVAVLAENSELGGCYCKTNVYITSQDRTIEDWKRTSERIPHIIPAMLASRWWDTSTPLYRRSVTDLAGPWKDFVNEEDWEYDCRMGFTNGALGYVPEVLSMQRRHDEPRLSEDGASDPIKLRSRVKARQAIIGYALSSESAYSSPEFKILLNYSFLLSRQCGAIGLSAESKELFMLVKQHLKTGNAKRLQLQCYQLGARLIGWVAMGRLSAWSDGLRK